MKLTKMAIAAVVFSSILSLTSLAGTWSLGQGENQNKWWYDNGDGSYVANEWKWIDGNNDQIAECYYFDSNGWLLTNTTAPGNFQVNENGAWTEAGIIKTQAVSNNSTTDNITQQSDIEVSGTYGYSYTTLYIWNEQSQAFEVRGKTPVYSGTVTFDGSGYSECYMEREAIQVSGDFAPNLTILNNTGDTLDIREDYGWLIEHYSGTGNTWFYNGYRDDLSEEISYFENTDKRTIRAGDSALTYSYEYKTDNGFRYKEGMPVGTLIRVETVYKK